MCGKLLDDISSALSILYRRHTYGKQYIRQRNTQTGIFLKFIMVNTYIDLIERLIDTN